MMIRTWELTLYGHLILRWSGCSPTVREREREQSKWEKHVDCEILIESVRLISHLTHLNCSSCLIWHLKLHSPNSCQPLIWWKEDVSVQIKLNSWKPPRCFSDRRREDRRTEPAAAKFIWIKWMWGGQTKALNVHRAATTSHLHVAAKEQPEKSQLSVKR